LVLPPLRSELHLQEGLLLRFVPIDPREFVRPRAGVEAEEEFFVGWRTVSQANGHAVTVLLWVDRSSYSSNAIWMNWIIFILEL